MTTNDQRLVRYIKIPDGDSGHYANQRKTLSHKQLQIYYKIYNHNLVGNPLIQASALNA